MAGKKFTLKDINNTIVESKEKEGGKVVKYKIEYKNNGGKDGITVDEKKGTAKITADKITKIVEGKTDETVTNKELEVSYVEGGWITHYGKIEKVDGKELEKPYEIGFSGIGSFRPTFWIVIVVSALAVVGGI